MNDIIQNIILKPKNHCFQNTDFPCNDYNIATLSCLIIYHAKFEINRFPILLVEKLFYSMCNLKNQYYIWIKGRIQSSGFLRIFTVEFLLFLAPARCSNLAR